MAPSEANHSRHFKEVLETVGWGLPEELIT
jgi:hypothetical protein